MHQTRRWIAPHPGILVLVGVVSFLKPSSTRAEITPPGKLAFYYAFPSVVNGAVGNLDEVVQTFGAYDAVVFGGDLELPQHTGAPGQNPNFGCEQTSHYDHDNTRVIIRRISPPTGHTQVFGYISIGGENTARQCKDDGPPAPHSTEEVQRRIDAWAAMGVAGVFFDEAEYSFGTTRKRQDAAIDYAHARSLRVFINGYAPGDVFDDDVVGKITYYDGFRMGQQSTELMNPGGSSSRLGSRDIYLLEHYQIHDSAFVDVPHWIERADEVFAFRARFGTAIAGVTTLASSQLPPGQCASLFDQPKLDYAWWSALLYGFEYVSWGEPNDFSAWGPCVNRLTPYTVPVVTGLGEFAGPVVHPTGARSSQHMRATTTGTIVVDTASHAGRFLPLK